MIENEEQYQMALALVTPLIELDPILGEPAADMVEHLVTLIEEYEESHSNAPTQEQELERDRARHTIHALRRIEEN